MRESAAAAGRYLRTGLRTIVCPVRGEGTSIGFEARVQGWRQDNYILLELSMPIAKAAFFEEGQSCALRFVADGAACHFLVTQVDWRHEERLPLVRMSWPTEVDVTHLRGHDRTEAGHLPCTLTHDSIRAEGTVEDICAKGFSVVTQLPVTVGARIQIGVALGEAGALTDVGTHVCSVRHLRTGGACLGLSIDHTQTADVSPLLRYLSAASGAAGSGQVSNASRVHIIARPGTAVDGLRGNLEQLRYPVTVSNDLHDALFNLRVSVPALIILELDWQGATALDACRVLRTSRALDGVPIFVFGQAADGSVLRGMQLEVAVRKAGGGAYFDVMPSVGKITASLDASAEIAV